MRASLRGAVLALGGVAAATTLAGSGPGARLCGLPDGVLAPDDLPEGSSVLACDAVGRIVVHDDAGVEIPEPGHGTSIILDGPTGGASLTVWVDDAGTISYTY